MTLHYQVEIVGCSSLASIAWAPVDTVAVAVVVAAFVRMRNSGMVAGVGTASLLESSGNCRRTLADQLRTGSC